jgi:hypothetical protein
VRMLAVECRYTFKRRRSIINESRTVTTVLALLILKFYILENDFIISLDEGNKYSFYAAVISVTNFCFELRYKS